ncbi:MAG: hypothetical protein QM486_01855 [Flavobacteriaceae bacterium]
MQFTLTVTDNDSGKTMTFNLIDKKSMELIHPDTNEVIANINIDKDGKPLFSRVGEYRWADDAAKCLLECSRDCDGDLFCVAGCAAMCSTIIIG